MSTVRPKKDTQEEPICPGCRSKDHWKCDTTAWDFREDYDVPTHCYCWARNHEERR